MIKPIEITNNDNGDVYTLEFNRDSVRFAEGHGFSLKALTEGETPMTSTADIFFYAFRMHHPKVSRAETDRMLFEELGGMPDGMLERLIELYAEPFNALIVKDDEERKNPKLTVTF